MEYMKPVDGNMWASVYMYKQRDSSAGAEDGKLFFGPLWDFDLSSGSANRAGNVVSSSGFYLKSNLNTGAQQSTKTWFHRLNEDADFRAAVKARWNQIKGSIDTTCLPERPEGHHRHLRGPDVRVVQPQLPHQLRPGDQVQLRC